MNMHFWLMYHVRRMVVWCMSACWIFTCFAMLENHEPPYGRRSVPCITLGALTTSFWEPWPQGFLLECSLTENMVQTCLVALYVESSWQGLACDRTNSSMMGIEAHIFELQGLWSWNIHENAGKCRKIHENAQIPSNSMESSWNMGGFQLSVITRLSPRHPKCAVAPQRGSFPKQRELRSEWRDVALAFPKSLEVTASSLQWPTKINRGNEAGNCTCFWCISFFSCGWCEKCSGRFTFSALQR